MKHRMLRKIMIVIAGLTIVILSTMGGVKAYWDAHYYAGYDAARPLNVEIASEDAKADYRRIAFSFDSVEGERVPSLLALPLEGQGPYPCIVFLHGIGQSKEFLDVIAAPFTKAGFAFVSFDQYSRGERKLKNVSEFKKATAIRRRAALNVLETRKLVDYLVTRPDIAAHRIYLEGASFGAITGCSAAAFDTRLRAVVLTYGGGDLAVLLASKAASSELGKWTQSAANLGAFLLAPGDPLKHVAQISPRPILFQNAEDDSLIPAASARALYNAAKDPKEIKWYSGDHIGTDEAMVWKVLNDAIEWTKARDAEIVEREGAARTAVLVPAK